VVSIRKYIWVFIPIIVVTIILSSCYRPRHSEDYYDGYHEGYEDGANDWDVLDEKFQSGIEIGREEGYEYGHSDGYSEGFDDGYGEGYEEGRDYGYELGREDFDRIESIVDDAVSRAKTYSEWHPDEALEIIYCYENKEAFWDNGSPPTYDEYLDAIDSLYGFYEYFYNGWYN
jgi:flagellar biosynthesis/type III secretory pathway protein FliH